MPPGPGTPASPRRLSLRSRCCRALRVCDAARAWTPASPRRLQLRSRCCRALRVCDAARAWAPRVAEAVAVQIEVLQGLEGLRCRQGLGARVAEAVAAQVEVLQGLEGLRCRQGLGARVAEAVVAQVEVLQFARLEAIKDTTYMLDMLRSEPFACKVKPGDVIQDAPVGGPRDELDDLFGPRCSAYGRLQRLRPNGNLARFCQAFACKPGASQVVWRQMPQALFQHVPGVIKLSRKCLGPETRRRRERRNALRIMRIDKVDNRWPVRPGSLRCDVMPCCT